MKTIGLAPLGSATLIENFDPLVLSEKARETLAAIADEDIRELVRDFFLDQRFRRDVFVRGNRQLDPEERRNGLLASNFALARPAAAIGYSITTPAGPYPYDNPAARAIVAALAEGPRGLVGLAPDPVSAEDLLVNILLLCAVGDAIPVEPGLASVEALNRVIFRRLDGPEEIRSARSALRHCHGGRSRPYASAARRQGNRRRAVPRVASVRGLPRFLDHVRGSSASRNPSPMKLIDSTARKIAPPANNAQCGAMSR